MAKLFGAQTSGYVAFYDRAGQLQLAGGVTPSRGHEGSNAGSKALEGAVKPEPNSPIQTPVFGCPLSDETQATTDDAMSAEIR